MLKASPQLLQLLRSVEADLARFTSQPGRRPEGIFADVLPFLVDQLQDWEAYAGAGQAAPLAQVSAPLESPIKCRALLTQGFTSKICTEYTTQPRSGA